MSFLPPLGHDPMSGAVKFWCRYVASRGTEDDMYSEAIDNLIKTQTDFEPALIVEKIADMVVENTTSADREAVTTSLEKEVLKWLAPRIGQLLRSDENVKTFLETMAEVTLEPSNFKRAIRLAISADDHGHITAGSPKTSVKQELAIEDRMGREGCRDSSISSRSATTQEPEALQLASSRLEGDVNAMRASPNIVSKIATTQTPQQRIDPVRPHGLPGLDGVDLQQLRRIVSTPPNARTEPPRSATLAGKNLEPFGNSGSKQVAGRSNAGSPPPANMPGEQSRFNITYPGPQQGPAARRHGPVDVGDLQSQKFPSALASNQPHLQSASSWQNLPPSTAQSSAQRHQGAISAYALRSEAARSNYHSVPASRGLPSASENTAGGSAPKQSSLTKEFAMETITPRHSQIAQVQRSAGFVNPDNPRHMRFESSSAEDARSSVTGEASSDASGQQREPVEASGNHGTKRRANEGFDQDGHPGKRQRTSELKVSGLHGKRAQSSLFVSPGPAKLKVADDEDDTSDAPPLKTPKERRGPVARPVASKSIAASEGGDSLGQADHASERGARLATPSKITPVADFFIEKLGEFTNENTESWTKRAMEFLAGRAARVPSYTLADRAIKLSSGQLLNISLGDGSPFEKNVRNTISNPNASLLSRKKGCDTVLLRFVQANQPLFPEPQLYNLRPLYAPPQSNSARKAEQPKKATLAAKSLEKCQTQPQQANSNVREEINADLAQRQSISHGEDSRQLAGPSDGGGEPNWFVDVPTKPSGVSRREDRHTQDLQRQEAYQQEAPTQGARRQDAYRQGVNRQDAVRYDAPEQDAYRQESSKYDTGRPAPTRYEDRYEAQSRHEPDRQDDPRLQVPQYEESRFGKDRGRGHFKRGRSSRGSLSGAHVRGRGSDIARGSNVPRGREESQHRGRGRGRGDIHGSRGHVQIPTAPRGSYRP